MKKLLLLLLLFIAGCVPGRAHVVVVAPTPPPCTGSNPENAALRQEIIKYYITHNRGCNTGEGYKEFTEAQPPVNATWKMIKFNIYRDWDYIYQELEKLANYNELPREFEPFFCTD